MNNEIKTLLALHKLSPPPTVITEEEVVEWLLDIIDDRNNKLSFINNIINMDSKYLNHLNMEIPECGLKLA